jgi:hypothetical protein
VKSIREGGRVRQCTLLNLGPHFKVPRSVAIEHVALAALRQIGLDKQLEALGLNGPQRAAAIGTLVARMATPGSELASTIGCNSIVCWAS